LLALPLSITLPLTAGTTLQPVRRPDRATTKKGLIDRIAVHTGDTHVLAEAVVQRFFHEITSELARGNRLEFRNFGVFEPKTTPARIAQNPKTLEKVEVPAKRRAVFKAGRLMKEMVDGHRTSSPAMVSPAPEQGER